jgi:hypothetical protein
MPIHQNGGPVVRRRIRGGKTWYGSQSALVRRVERRPFDSGRRLITPDPEANVGGRRRHGRSRPVLRGSGRDTPEAKIDFPGHRGPTARVPKSFRLQIGRNARARPGHQDAAALWAGDSAGIVKAAANESPESTGMALLPAQIGDCRRNSHGVTDPRQILPETGPLSGNPCDAAVRPRGVAVPASAFRTSRCAETRPSGPQLWSSSGQPGTSLITNRDGLS